MNRKLFCTAIIICFLCCPVFLVAQNKTIDSLRNILTTYTSQPDFERDTNYLNTLNELGFKYAYLAPDTTIVLSQKVLTLCKQINYFAGEAEALKNIGLVFNVKSEYNKSLSYYSAALKIALAHGYKTGAGKIYHNIGIVYSNLGKYPEALDNYFEALKIREELGEKPGIASSTNGIGAIYFVQGKYKEADTFYLKALKIAEEINFLSGKEAGYSNIGELNFRQGNYTEAKHYLLKALDVTKETGNKEAKAFVFTLLASIYNKEGKYNDAIVTFQQAKEVAIEVGTREYLSRSQIGLAEVYLALKKTDSALVYAQEGIKTAEGISYTELLRDGNEILSRIYEAKGLGMQAYYHYKLFKQFADSINNLQTEQRAANLAAEYEYSKKEIQLKADQAKKDLEFQRKSTQQWWIIFSALAALFTALVVASLIYRSRQKEKHSNQLLHQQNEEIEKQKNTLQLTLKDLKATQSQLIQSEKMASLGELTAGIAHEIQNPLNFVNNFSEVNAELIAEMKEEIENGNYGEVKIIATDIAVNEQKINHHGKRADAIVKGMLQHSRSSIGVKEPSDINALADEYLRLAYHGLRAKDNSFNAKLETDFDEGIGNINIIPQDIGRVLLNLYNNAFYAVKPPNSQKGEHYQPSVKVSTKKIGDKVEIRVSDNGSGIPQKIVDKIFQPFFTTKPTGQGTGLGLSLSYDIVKAHGGEITVETTEGEGTTFIIQLPTQDAL
ncbi:tetratricopeptide repeat protein [Panacibacter ginsenosidivorans]|uniref:histidine kinase n=1 Tax=Panacibacter ginsenosidivorans TaxID=1813871 RepID=A0A5B8VFU4_9BACT|nr:tetratricopeptide repeat protein [Panacibacter ginsenosidivorans]QEC69941.1 tetratricopeptide repeat protein [Panacibacter ginsenosidivorans]